MPLEGSRPRSPRIISGMSQRPGRPMEPNSSSLPARPPTAACSGCRSASRPDRAGLGSRRGDVSGPAISLHQARLAYSLEKLHANIWRLDLGNSGRTPAAPVRFISSTKWDAAPAYSPTGAKIAFVSIAIGNSRALGVRKRRLECRPTHDRWAEGCLPPRNGHGTAGVLLFGWSREPYRCLCCQRERRPRHAVSPPAQPGASFRSGLRMANRCISLLLTNRSGR